MSQDARPPSEPFDCNRLIQRASSLLPDELNKRLQELFQFGSQSMRIFLVGCLLTLMASSARPQLLSFESRQRSFSNITDAALTHRWAQSGFHSDGAGGASCFHCGCGVRADRLRTGDPAQSHARQGAAHGCILQRLLRILGSEGRVTDAEIAAEATDFAASIRNLQADLQRPVVGFVQFFGFSRDHVALALLRRRITRQQSGICSEMRPGDLIGLIHELPLDAARMPWSITQLLEAVTQDQRRQAKDNAPPPLETRDIGEIGSTPVHRPSHRSRPDEKSPPARPQTAQPQSVEAGLDSETQQPVDAPPSENANCILCQRRVRNRVSLPCAHLVACNVCLDGRRECPLCGAAILASINANIG